MITSLLGRVKIFLADYGKDLWIAGVVFLVSLLSFGLGRLSALSSSRTAVTIEPTSRTASVSGVPAGTVGNEPTPTDGRFVASKNGTAFHLMTCPGAKQIKDENKIWFSSREAAIAAGYRPAGNCPGL